MKRLQGLLIAMLALLLVACSGNKEAEPTASEEKKKPEMIIEKTDEEVEGAAAYKNEGDRTESRYYKNPDFYNLSSDNELTIIPKFKTFQQTKEWSCGNGTALMVMTHFEDTDYTEMAIATEMKSSTDLDVPDALPGSANNFPEYGTSLKQLHEFFEGQSDYTLVESSYQAEVADADLLTEEDGVSPADQGNLPGTFHAMSLYASENDANTDQFVEDAKDSYFVKWLTGHLKEERPVMVEWGDWDGHWQAIIGYDNNGTPGIGDDVLILADPYDTSDHWQDGYYYYPLERWFYMWKDRNIAPKPYQLQPYVIVDYKK